MFLLTLLFETQITLKDNLDPNLLLIKQSYVIFLFNIVPKPPCLFFNPIKVGGSDQR